MRRIEFEIEQSNGRYSCDLCHRPIPAGELFYIVYLDDTDVVDSCQGCHA